MISLVLVTLFLLSGILWWMLMGVKWEILLVQVETEVLKQRIAELEREKYNENQ